MKFSTIAGTAILAATTTLAKPVNLGKRGPYYPRQATNSTTNEADRAAAVIEAFRHAWTGYYTYAFPNDELHPVSDTYGNSRNGWGASAVDALSTAIIMQQQDIVNEILDHIVTIDYRNTTTEVSLFETTIRYLAGMLSGYDLLNGPFSNLVGSRQAEVESLLDQSKNLADVLKFAFNTTTGIPVNDIDIVSQTFSDTQNGLATIGTLVIEWTHLSDLLNDPSYGELAQKGESYLLNPQPSYNVPFPGLLGDTVDVTTGDIVTATGGWVGGDDSFYEYLIKAYVYDPTRFATYKDRWLEATSSTIQYLTSHPDSRPDLTFVAEFNNKTLVLESQHLACFDGGNFLLGGAVLKNQTLIDYGLALVDGCHDTYNSTATHIGPEVFSWDPTAVPADQAEFYDANGFYITDSIYDLRPEVIESYYYAYRVTGDSKYQDWAWDAFVAINATTRTSSGFSEVANVNELGGGGYDDLQESFLFAEVMKYAYIIHVGDAVWQVEDGGVNNYVFNTEAHPFKVKGTPI